jgi:PAS domain S-box-containing protein
MHESHSLTKTDFQSLFENLPVAIYGCDVNGKVTFYNEATLKLFGRKPEIGKEFWRGLKNYPLNSVPQRINTEELQLANDLVTIQTEGGRHLNVLFNSKAVFNEAGEIVGTINMFVNINGVKKLVPYHKMVEEVEDYAILLLDKDGNIVSWNKGAQKIKGYSEDEIIGKNFRIFYGAEDRESRLPEKLLAHAIRYGKATHEGWRIRKGETQFWGNVVITALHDDDGELVGFTKVTRDLTERKLAEDQIRTKAKELEFRNLELEQFAYVASHDLQEPLRKIQVFANLLENNIKKSGPLVFLRKISSSAHRMSVLIKDILQYARLSQHDELFQDVDLNVVLRNVLSDFEVLIEQKRVTIEHGILPVIKGIPVQLDQLVANLINNAIKFNDKEPLIEITSQQVFAGDLNNYQGISQTREYVKLTIKDNGIGFDSRYVEEIFGLFKRLQNREPGTGIGLALCKKIVENHGGHISVSSEVGVGTIFNIVLPVK